jgi:Glu-tRNA(Gln) amidotransferase subunit E-like FAD-binding protein
MRGYPGDDMSVVDKLNSIDEIIEVLKLREKRLDEIVSRLDSRATERVGEALGALDVAGNKISLDHF